MGKRLQRIFYKDVPAALPGLFNKDISLVLVNETTFFGKIIKQEGALLFVRDKIMRKHKIEIKNIYEIVIDTEAIY